MQLPHREQQRRTYHYSHSGSCRLGRNRRLSVFLRTYVKVDGLVAALILGALAALHRQAQRGGIGGGREFWRRLQRRLELFHLNIRHGTHGFDQIYVSAQLTGHDDRRVLNILNLAVLPVVVIGQRFRNVGRQPTGQFIVGNVGGFVHAADNQRHALRDQNQVNVVPLHIEDYRPLLAHGPH